eukprot:CAMPEP_0177176710 /NCGR_PEP_ID=MMETSP0367-20130122/13400_1 /TAXON_ID=447022 ORGANISM="Scrippsiella hangoei-like, Strain SHHI-4" /NCGR_SAMPLE_ID=MMETSP0367 /ASSEMBLY_ACC=CAM_ASM_000362 /LENGTH=215 /DNA_ID=CAMNT_0018623239 /DNA_START=218 /DNA_END=863 /DNA_ORIENTATION=-
MTHKSCIRTSGPSSGMPRPSPRALPPSAYKIAATEAAVLVWARLQQGFEIREQPDRRDYHGMVALRRQNSSVDVDSIRHLRCVFDRAAPIRHQVIYVGERQAWCQVFPTVCADRQVVAAIEMVQHGNGPSTRWRLSVLDNREQLSLAIVCQSMCHADRSHIVDILATTTSNVRVDDERHPGTYVDNYCHRDDEQRDHAPELWSVSAHGEEWIGAD